MIKRILDKGSFVLGDCVSSFEKVFAERFNLFNAVGVANGTDALTLALACLDLPEKSLIATVSNAGGYSTNAILATKLLPFYIDISQESTNMDPNALTRALKNNAGIKAVIFTNLYGNMTGIAEIAAICLDFKIPLIEDCAQSVGARIDDAYSGTFGDISCFSFFPTKNLGALGDAGLVATKSLSYFERLKMLRQYGWDKKYYVAIEGGLNSRMDEIQAAVLLIRLENLESDLVKRRKILEYYNSNLPTEISLMTEFGVNTSPHLAVLKCANPTALKSHLSKSNISTDIHYPVIDSKQSAWGHLEFDDQKCPNSLSLSAHILTVPLFPGMHENEITLVGESLKSANMR